MTRRTDAADDLGLLAAVCIISILAVPIFAFSLSTSRNTNLGSEADSSYATVNTVENAEGSAVDDVAGSDFDEAASDSSEGFSSTSSTPMLGGMTLSQVRDAYWWSVLREYPFLPEALERSLSTVIVGRGSQQHAFTANNIDVLVTDLSSESRLSLAKRLRDLREKQISQDTRPASMLGAMDDRLYPSAKNAHETRFMFIGHDAKINIAGPKQGAQHVSIFYDQVTSANAMNVFACTDAGASLKPSLSRFGPFPRGPPFSSNNYVSPLSPRPPPGNLTLVLIGKSGSINVDGPRGFATQNIKIDSRFVDHTRAEVYGTTRCPRTKAALEIYKENGMRPRFHDADKYKSAAFEVDSAVLFDDLLPLVKIDGRNINGAGEELMPAILKSCRM